MEHHETKDPALEPPETPAPAPLRRSPRPRPWARSLLLSLFLHTSALAMARVWGVDWSRTRTGESGLRVARLVLERKPREELPVVEEPQRVPEVPETPLEPELVEAPPRYPDPPEPILDWIPPLDLLASVEDFDRTPARGSGPEAAPRPAAGEPHPAQEATPTAETQPVAGEPEVLEGPSFPQVLEAPPPRYPRQALRLGWEGSVTLLVTVDAAGRVRAVRVEESSGHRVLDEEAVAAFRRWVFCERRPGDPERRLVRKRFVFRVS